MNLLRQENAYEIIVYKILAVSTKSPFHEWLCHPNYNEVIAKKLYTWLGNCDVVACAKCCSVMMPYNGVTPIPIFHMIRITAHYTDVIMSAMASQITSLATVYSTVYLRRRSKKISKLRITGLVRGSNWWPVNSRHKGPVTRKCFYLITSSCEKSFVKWIFYPD